MKRKTRHRALLETVDLLIKQIKHKDEEIAKLQRLEEARNEAWSRHTDERIREINSAIRSSK